MFIIRHKIIFYTFSAILVIGSIVAMLVWGLNSSIDFKGGSLLEVSYSNGRPSQSIVIAAITPLNLSASVIPSETNEYDIRTVTLSDAQKNSLISVLSALEPSSTSTMPIKIGSTTAMATVSSPSMQVTGFNTIGPTLGAEAAWKSIVAVILVILAIVLFIAWAFRKVSEPVSSWKYGIVAIIDLVHNIMIPLGVFAVLGHFYGYEVDTLFVTSLLVVLGFSVHDTIVVFDRIRENLRTMPGSKPFSEIVGTSINQTFVRSINTSLVVLFALAVLYFVGGAPTQHFALALIIGIAAGTYASICLGSPLLVTIEKAKLKPEGKWVFWWFVISVGLSQISSNHSDKIEFFTVLLSVIIGYVLYKISIKTKYLDLLWKKIFFGLIFIVLVIFLADVLSALLVKLS